MELTKVSYLLVCNEKQSIIINISQIRKNRKAKECKEYIDIDKQKKAASVVAFREAYDEFPIISSVLSLFYV
jgi:hypothetical protein